MVELADLLQLLIERAVQTCIGAWTSRRAYGCLLWAYLPSLTAEGTKRLVASQFPQNGVATYDAALEHAHNVPEFHFLCTEGQTTLEPGGSGNDIRLNSTP